MSSVNIVIITTSIAISLISEFFLKWVTFANV